MAIQIIITLHIIETIRLPPTDICDNVLINACVITHIHKPVSYTHLDVYKRQSMISTPIPAARQAPLEKRKLRKWITGLIMNILLSVRA